MSTIAIPRTPRMSEYTVAGGVIIAIGLAAFSIWLPRYGVAFTALVLLALALAAVAIRPKRALFIYVVALPLHNLLMALLFRATGDITFVKFMQPWKEYILAVAFLRVGVPAARNWLQVRRIRLTALDTVIVLFIALCALSVLLPSHVIHLTGRIYGFRELVLPMSLYFLGRLLPLNRRDMRILVGLLAFDVLAFALVAIGERLFWGSALFVALDYGSYTQMAFGTTSYLPYNIPNTFFTGSPFWLPRVGSLALNPLDLATLLLIGLPILLAARAVMRGQMERAQALRLGPALFLGGVALLLAFGRASLLLLPVECIVLLLWGNWRRQWRGMAILLVGCVLGGLLITVTASYVLQVTDSSMRVLRSTEGLTTLVATSYGTKTHVSAFAGARNLVQESTSPSNGSTQGHVATYKRLSKLIIKRPLGYGIGSAGFVGVRFNTNLGAESSYLPVGVELGALGLLLYLLIYAGTIYACWAAAQARGDPLTRAVFLGITAVWVFVALDGVITEVTLNFFVMYFVFWMAGAAVTYLRASRLAPATTEGEAVATAARPLRVAMDVQCLKTARTGVRTYVNELLEQFARPDAPHVVVPIAGPERLPNSKRIFRIINQAVHQIWLHCWLPLELAIGNYDVLFSPEYLTPIWTPTARVVTYHASSFLRRPEDYNRLWQLMFRWVTLPAIRHADAVVVPSRYAANEGIKLAGLDPERVRVTPLGGPGDSASMQVDEQCAAATLARYGVTPRAYILHVGVLERRKNLVTLIEAFAMWRQQGGPTHFKLALVGQAGPRPDLDDSAAIRQAIAAHGLSDAVILTGHLSLAERNAFYTHAAAVAIPSTLEGFGLPVLEAFAAQVPVVCAQAGALPEVAGNAALLFDPASPQELAQCLARLGADPALRAGLVRAGNERLRCFTWERTAAATFQAFEEACVHAYAPTLVVPSLGG
jgi:glycosyltransferase involved in cell wall biosynthesis